MPFAVKRPFGYQSCATPFPLGALLIPFTRAEDNPAVFLCGVLDWFTLLLRLYSTHSGPIIHILWLVKAVSIRRRAG